MINEVECAYCVFVDYFESLTATFRSICVEMLVFILVLFFTLLILQIFVNTLDSNGTELPVLVHVQSLLGDIWDILVGNLCISAVIMGSRLRGRYSLGVKISATDRQRISKNQRLHIHAYKQPHAKRYEEYLQSISILAIFDHL